MRKLYFHELAILLARLADDFKRNRTDRIERARNNLFRTQERLEAVL